MTGHYRFVLGVAARGLAAGLGYAIRAAASGFPASNALSYAGVLEDATGPISGSHNILVTLYDAATGGNNLCQSAPAALAITDGHFSVQLPDACTTAVGANPNVWVDVLVDGSDTGRTKVGAVPYAVEAKHTPNADTASAAAGALAQQIVPSGAVVAFNLAACPVGWSPLATAGGRTIIGVNAAGGNGLSARNLGDTVGEETHTLTVAGDAVALAHRLGSHARTLAERRGRGDGPRHFDAGGAREQGSQRLGYPRGADGVGEHPADGRWLGA